MASEPGSAPAQEGNSSSSRIKVASKPARRLLSPKSLNLSFAQRKVAVATQQQQQQNQQQQSQEQQRQQQEKQNKHQHSHHQKQQQQQHKKPHQTHHTAMASGRPQQTENLVDGDSRTMRDIDRPPPGDPSTRNRMSQVQVDNAKRRSTYFENEFASTKKEKVSATSVLTDRVRSEAIVMAEVRTNVILSDEFTFITELSYNLSLRFQRPVSSIVVSIQHGVCMMFGGTFEPAYSMSVFALPSQVQPTTNKRNAVLIQNHMEEVLGVPSTRGLLRFVPMPEENVAVSGRTIATEITELAREAGVELIDDDDPSNKRRSKMLRNRLSVRQSFGNFKPSVQDITPPTSASDHAPPVPALPALPPIPSPPPDQYQRHSPPERPRSSPAGKPSFERKTRRRKSFVASIFGWPKEDEAPPVPM